MGTFPVGAGLMVLFGRLSTALFSSSWADNLQLHEEGLGFLCQCGNVFGGRGG